jgi:cobalt-zinc-cadmium resistance protein CzcA
MRAATFFPLIFFMTNLFAQTSTLDQLMQTALKNNRAIQAASFDVESQKQLKKTGVNLPKADAMITYGQYNTFAKDNNVTVTQSIPFTVMGSQARLNRTMVASSELKKLMTENELSFRLKRTYYQLLYTHERKRLLQTQDSIYEGFLKSASARYRTGEGTLLEQTTAETQRNDIKNQLRKVDSDISILETELKTVVNSNQLPSTVNDRLTTLDATTVVDSAQYTNSPILSYSKQQVVVADAERKVESARLAPDLLVGFFTQTLIGTPNQDGSLATTGQRFTGMQVGLSIPLWMAPYQGRVKAATFNKQSVQSQFEQTQIELQGQHSQAIQQLESNRSSLTYYTSSALPNANRILTQSSTAFKNGEISYAEYLMGLRNALSIKESYLQTLNDYNQSIIYLQYITGNH